MIINIQIWEDPGYEHEEGEHGDGGGAVEGGQGSDGGEPAEEQEYQGGGGGGITRHRMVNEDKFSIFQDVV